MKFLSPATFLGDRKVVVAAWNETRLSLLSKGKQDNGVGIMYKEWYIW